jgi:hypothetical protein
MPSMVTDPVMQAIIAIVVLFLAFSSLSAISTFLAQKNQGDLDRISDKQRIIIAESPGEKLTCSKAGGNYNFKVILEDPKIRYSVGDEIGIMALGEINFRRKNAISKAVILPGPGKDLKNPNVFDYDPSDEQEKGFVQLGKIYADINNIEKSEIPFGLKFSSSMTFWKNSICVNNAIEAGASSLKSIIDTCPEEFLGGHYFDVSDGKLEGNCDISGVYSFIPISNPGFETEPKGIETDWAEADGNLVIWDKTLKHDGDYSYKTVSGFSKCYNPGPGRYYISFFALAENDYNPGIKPMKVVDCQASDVVVGMPQETGFYENSWKKIEMEFTSDGKPFSIQLNGGNVGDYIWYDDFNLIRLGD